MAGSDEDPDFSPDSDKDSDYQPHSEPASERPSARPVARPVARPPSPSPSVELVETSSPGLRRSTRVRNRPPPRRDLSPQAPQSPRPAAGRLEQLSYHSADDLGLSPSDPAAGLRVRVHPVAAMLMSVHAHLTRTEVIGYLGGTVHMPDDAPGETHIVVVEAFSARAVDPRDLARSGRSAFREVEIDPQSSVEVMACIHSKGLEVVGWYHSHPDASFTVEPSRVDIENQDNYQSYLFKEKPFVAAIIAPYNEDLPDFSPAVEFFRVYGGEIPLRLPHVIDTLATVPAAALPQYWPDGCPTRRRYPLLALEQECFCLVDEHKHSTKRVRLSKSWRDAFTCADKLRGALITISEVCEPPSPQGAEAPITGQPSTSPSEAERFLDCVNRVVEYAEQSYSRVAAEEAEERAARRQRSIAQKAKRSRRY